MTRQSLDVPQLAEGYVDVTSKALALRKSVSRVLAGWTAEEVEEEAWIFALDGWQRPLELGRQYDTAYEAYLQYLEKAANPGPNSTYYALETLRHLLEELRNRIQFIQTRGADIRLSHQFQRVVDVTGERIFPRVDELLQDLRNGSEDGRELKLRKFENEHGPMLRAFANAVGRRSGALGASVLAAEPYVEQAKRAVRELEDLGVIGNAVWEALKHLASG